MVVVTGASRGLGNAIAERLRSNGVEVVGIAGQLNISITSAFNVM